MHGCFSAVSSISHRPTIVSDELEVELRFCIVRSRAFGHSSIGFTIVLIKRFIPLATGLPSFCDEIIAGIDSTARVMNTVPLGIVIVHALKPEEDRMRSVSGQAK